MKEITLEQINKYNQMVEAASGTRAYYKIALLQEYKPDDSKSWYPACGCFCLCKISTYTDGMRFYIKTVRGTLYLYMDLDGEPADRYCIEDKEIARLFFGV